MNQRDFEAQTVTPPLKNSTAMKCIAVLGVNTTLSTQDLRALFGSHAAGHYYTLQADGTKVYVAFGSSAGTIDERATGVGETVCYPIPDGGSLPFVPIGGREVATGFATMIVDYNVLHYKAATGSATGYLRIYRSSVGPGQGSEQFPFPRGPTFVPTGNPGYTWGSP